LQNGLWLLKVHSATGCPGFRSGFRENVFGPRSTHDGIPQPLNCLCCRLWSKFLPVSWSEPPRKARRTHRVTTGKKFL